MENAALVNTKCQYVAELLHDLQNYAAQMRIA